MELKKVYDIAKSERCSQWLLSMDKSIQFVIEEQVLWWTWFEKRQNEDGPIEYMVKDKLDFPIFEEGWTAEDELKLLHGVAKAGIDNWFEVHLKYLQNKTAEEIEAHFYAFYNINKPSETNLEDSLNRQIISSPRNPDGQYTYSITLSSENTSIKTLKLNQIYTRNTKIFGTTSMKTLRPRQTPSLTDLSDLPLSDPNFRTHSLTSTGYNAKRDAFDIEFDEDAESNIVDIDFSMLFSPAEITEKIEYLKIYNERLDERERRRKFVLDRNLTDLSTVVEQEMGMGEGERQVLKEVRPLAQFLGKEAYGEVEKEVLEEYRLAEMIEELKVMQESGFRTVGDVERYLGAEKKAK